METRHAWSILVSFLTASAIPGYGVERRPLHVDLAWRDSARTERRERLEYESRMRYFVWLPFVVKPDFFMSVNGGWVSAEAKDSGFEGAIARLADDLRVRLDGGAPPDDVAGVTCPSGVAASRWETIPAPRGDRPPPPR